MISEEAPPRYLFKIVLVGDLAVGKTSLRRRYMGVGFSESHIATLGADFSHKDLDIDNIGIIRTQIWDIAGQQMFSLIRAKFLGGAGGAIVTYDVTRSETFTKVQDWLEEVWEVNKTKNIPTLIVGNKIDLDNQRVVNSNDVNEFCINLKKEHNLSYIEHIETSAKTGENVMEAFSKLAVGIVNMTETS